MPAGILLVICVHFTNILYMFTISEQYTNKSNCHVKDGPAAAIQQIRQLT